jgi:hypothetical protein
MIKRRTQMTYKKFFRRMKSLINGDLLKANKELENLGKPIYQIEMSKK